MNTKLCSRILAVIVFMLINGAHGHAQSQQNNRLKYFSEICSPVEDEKSQLVKSYNQVKEVYEQFHQDFPNTIQDVFVDLIFLEYLADLPKPTRLNEIRLVWNKILAVGNQYYSFLANISMIRAYALEMTPESKGMAKTVAEEALRGLKADAIQSAFIEVKAIDRIAFPNVSEAERTNGVNAAETILKNMILLYNGELDRNHKDLTVP
ncbi:MAG: hypothetical protein H7Y36_03755 [Armatimonadetes bacterium]|nr:hypothetical protein [Akkermansiaceae bacterium]